MERKIAKKEFREINHKTVHIDRLDEMLSGFVAYCRPIKSATSKEAI